MKTMKVKNLEKPRKGTLRSTARKTPAKILKILATTDFSDASRIGVRYAVALAEKLGASVALLHVIEPRSQLSELGSLLPACDDSKMVALASAQLAKLAKNEGKGKVAITFSVRTGKPFHEITTAAGQDRADLIVIATHGYTGIEQALLGSVAERVVRHAPCSALTVPARLKPKRTGSSSPFKLKKILVPIDFSKISTDALPQAAHLASRFGAELVLLHVVETFPIDYIAGRESMNYTIEPLRKKAEADLEDMGGSLSESTGLKVSMVVKDGKPFEEICRTAKILNADLIALTTHGYTGLKHVWLGSTAERVIRHAPCPVMAVRERNQKTP